jgi:DNA-binding CsgD family transcriptional regulator
MAGALAGISELEPVSRAEGLLVAGLLSLAAGSSAQAEDHLQFVLQETLHRAVDVAVEGAAALARLRLAAGRIDEALEVTDEPIGILAAKGIWVWATDVAPARVDALAAAGRIGEAAELVTVFAGGLRGRDAPAPRAGLVLCRAILSEGQGEHTRAAGLFARSAAAWRALPRPYEAALSRERQAGCLLAVGRLGAGVAVLSQVFQDLSALGATGDADRVAHVLRGQGVPVPRTWRGGRRGYGDQLSPRELEVVRLVAAGRTNREIAGALSRSTSTIATQLRSASRKLGVSSRSSLAARAVEAGLVSTRNDQDDGERS